MAKKQEQSQRTFEGTRKGNPFVVKTCLSNAEAIDLLRDAARGKSGDSHTGFESDCADHIDIMEMRSADPTSR